MTKWARLVQALRVMAGLEKTTESADGFVQGKPRPMWGVRASVQRNPLYGLCLSVVLNGLLR